MKILIVNCVYQEGSTGKIVATLSEGLRAMGHDVFTCYGLGKDYYDDYSGKICTTAEHKFNAVLKRLTGIPHGGIYLSNSRIKHIIRDFKPDVIHVHSANPSVFNVYKLFENLAKSGIRTVFTLHAEIAHTAGCEHAFDCNKWKEGCHDCASYRTKVNSWFFDRSRTSYRKMQDAIKSFDEDKLTVTAVSPWLADRARLSAIMKDYRVVYVPNGVNTSVFYRREKTLCLNEPDYRKVVLFVTPYFSVHESDNKGGRYVIKLASDMPEVKFVIVAGRQIGEIGSLPDNVRMWGKAKSQDELACLYSDADVTLLLSHRETFSMVMAESLCCGTPVVGFKAGGPESIALNECCEFVEYGDLDSLKSSIEQLAQKKDRYEISSKAINLYSQRNMCDCYLKCYMDL